MADNFSTKDAADATITGAADEIAGVKFPRVKLIQGADGTNDGDVSSAAPLQVTLANTGANSNKLLVTPDLPSGASTAAKQGIGGTDLVGGAGAVAAGVQRVTLASDDPAVAKLGTIDTDTGNIATDASTIAGDTTSIDGKITACNTGAVVLAAGTALAGKVGIDQVTANANEVVVKSGSCTVDLGANNDVTVTNATTANCKVEATIAAAQTIAVTNAGTFAVQAAPTVPAGATAGQGKLDHADVTTAQAITTAVADKYFYITSLTISSSVAGNFWIEDDDAAQITCKFYFAPNGGSTQTFTPQTPWKSTTVNKGLKIKGSVAGAIGAMITYYTAT